MKTEKIALGKVFAVFDAPYVNAKAIYTPWETTGGNCLLWDFSAREGQDQKSWASKIVRIIVTFYRVIPMMRRGRRSQSLIVVASLGPVSGILLEQVAQSIDRRRISFEEAINNLLQFFARNRIELEVSFLGLGDKFRVF